MTEANEKKEKIAAPGHWQLERKVGSLAAAIMTARASEAVDSKPAAIRRAAYLCFAKHGYHGTTVDLICAEAHISKGAFYWHYDSKQAVFLAILNTWADEVSRELDKQFASALRSADVYTNIRVALSREAHRVRAILPIWLEFIAQSGRNSEMRAAIAKFHHRIREVMVRLLLPSLSSTFGEEEVQVLASTILGAFIGVVSQSVCEPGSADFEAHIERVLAMIKRIFQDKQA